MKQTQGAPQVAMKSEAQVTFGRSGFPALSSLTRTSTVPCNFINKVCQGERTTYQRAGVQLSCPETSVSGGKA